MNRFLLLAALAFALSACSYMPSWMGGKKEEKPKLAGERIAVLPELSALTPDTSAAATPITIPSPVINPEWPQHTGTISAATGNLAVRGPLQKVASVKIGDGNSTDHTLVVRPVAGGGLVFAMDAAGYLSAHDGNDIEKVLWHSKGMSEKGDPDVMGGGLAYYQGRLYATSGRGLVAAFDANNGKEIWRRMMRLPLRSAPRVAGDKLYAVTIDNETYALNIANGEPVWSQQGIQETAGLMNVVSPAVSGDIVVVPYSSGEIYALSAADGRERWDESLSQSKQNEASAFFAGIGGDPVIDGEVVFAVSNSGMLGVFGLANGQRLWALPVGSINTPWLAGNYLYVLTSDNVLTCLLKYDGKVEWSVPLPSYKEPNKKRDPITWKGPIMIGGAVAVTSSKGELKLFSAIDGQKPITREIPEGIFTAPIVANGKMYLVGQNAKLYSLE